MSVNSAVNELDFANIEQMWLTEAILYICSILIWYLSMRMLWVFCISPNSPRFKQFDARALKPIKAKAEQSRRIKQSEYTPCEPTRTSNNRLAAISAHKPCHKLGQESTGSASELIKETPEEFQLQICKIHRSLRLCFVTSLICAVINCTAVMMNHTLIISGAITRHCLISRLPVTSQLFQRLALYLFFIFRLHYSFGATQFGIKPLFIWLLIVLIVICGVTSTGYFFYVIASAPDPCKSNLAAKAATPALANDFFWNIALSVLFLSRLGAAVKSQSKYTGSSTRNLQKAQLQKARANYKYYYTMYKLTLLFISALVITVSVSIVIYLTGLAAASSAIDSVTSNFLLFLSFQFNDHHFRKLFCGCLRFQSCFLGAAYSNEMEFHFEVNANRKPHNQSSRTWQEGDIEATRAVTSTQATDLKKIQEERGGDRRDSIENSNMSQTESKGTPTDTNDKKVNIVITHLNNEENESEPALNKLYTIDSEMSIDNETFTNENERNVLDTPVDDMDKAQNVLT